MAKRTGPVTLLQVGHIERFNPAFEELQRLPLRPRVVNCQRLSAFSGRSTDIGAVLDLMIHDIDLLLTLVKAPVERVDAVVGGPAQSRRVRTVSSGDRPSARVAGGEITHTEL